MACMHALCPIAYQQGYYYLHNVLVTQYSDMNEEMRVEAMELCVTACEKHAASNEVRKFHWRLVR